MPWTGVWCLSTSSVVLAQLPAVGLVHFPDPPFEISLTPADQESGRLSSSVRLAQTPPTIPPGTIEPPRPDLPPAPETIPTPPPPPQLELPPQPTPSEPPPAIEAKIQIKQVEVLGSTAFSKAELAQVVRPFVGKQATFEQLLAIRTAVTELYTRNGYTTSGAFLPPQDISQGTIKIQVVEGELERIEIQGLKRLQASYARDRIALATQTPLNIRRLESALQLLQLDPLFSRVQAELTAGTGPGRSILILDLKEAPPLSGALLIENRDSPSVGSIRGSALLSHRNLLGFGDRLNAEVGRTGGILSYNFGYEVPLNARDGTLSLRYDNGNSRIIEQPFAPLDIEGDTQTYSLGFRQPIRRTPTSEFALSLTGDLRRSQTFFEDDPVSFPPVPEDEEGQSRVSVIRFSQDWVSRSRNRVLAARSQFSLGLGILGATVNDTGPDGRFFSWLGQFQWVQALSQDATLIARVGSQLTGNSLLPLEQFSIGGVDTVRGYRQNQRVGDNGVAGSVELRVPVVRSDSIGLIQLAPFFDVGTIWNNQGEIPAPSTLVSLGLGLSWQLAPYFAARLDYGIPLNPISDQGNSLQDNGLFFSIRVQPF